MNKQICKNKYGGYGTKSFFFITLFNIVFAFIFIVLLSPLFAVLALLVKLRDRGPILYKCTRLGRCKRPFYMYKFRTLPVGSNKIIGTRILTPEIIKNDKITRILRDTRLDELPQLFNMLKGDMDFVGPRPVRPEIYERYCKQIPDYDVRFEVRPGLIGFSQLFTPHSAPKRLRSLIDNKHIHHPRSLFKDIVIILFAFQRLTKLTLVKTFNYFRMSIIKSKILKEYEEKRSVDRIRPQKANVYLKNHTDEKFDYLNVNVLSDINESHFKMYSNQSINDNTYLILIRKEIVIHKKTRRRNAYCQGKIIKRLDSTDNKFKFIYIVSYKAMTEFNQYMIDKYFLQKSIA